MIDRLKTLSPMWRYLLHVVGMLVLFSLALGVGAIAAMLVGRQFEGNHGGPGEMSALEGSKLETTGIARSSGSPANPPSTNSGQDESDYEASFVHEATTENSRGDFTYVSDPSINGNPKTVVVVTPTSSQKGGELDAYNHNIGVWYAREARKWAIFNQDRAAVPKGATFRVEVPPASQTFVHHADLLNTVDNYTYLDDRLTNDKPDAVLFITQNWNPGGGRGVYNNHPVGTIYDAKVDKWAILNEDGASISNGAAFNVAVSADSNTPAK